MSTDPRPELAAERDVFRAPWSRLIAFVALFLRLALGLGLVNAGLALVLAPSGPGGPFGPNFRPGAGGMMPVMPGFEGVSTLLPYAELAVGVGLIFGIFTVIAALAACALALLSPALMTLTLMMNAGIGPMPNRMGMAFEYLLLLPGQAVLSQALLVLLSPVAINRYSIDALIFARAAAPIFPEPAETPEPTPVDESP